MIPNEQAYQLIILHFHEVVHWWCREFHISFHEKNTIQFWGLRPWNHSRPVAADQAVTVESPKPVESQPEVEITGSTGSCLKDGVRFKPKNKILGLSIPEKYGFQIIFFEQKK